MNPNSFLFVAGGSGGHVFPAIAVAEALKDKNPKAEITFMGVGTPIEKKLLSKGPWDYEIIPSVAIRGKGILGLLRLAWHFPQSFFKARALIKKSAPKACISFGGYPTVIPVLAAKSLRIPCVMQEQNRDVGLANSFLSLFVQKIFAAHGAGKGSSRGFWRKPNLEFVMNPVRKIFSEIPTWSAPKDGEQFTLVILGGSQGAVSLNTEILKLIDLFKENNIRVVHQAGAKDLERVKKEYEKQNFKAEVFDFINSIEKYYNQAHLLICRAGAMTIAEVSESARPAIYVPLPIAGGHQGENAKPLVEKGAAAMFEHGEQLSEQLRNELIESLKSSNSLSSRASKAREYSRSSGASSSKHIAAYLSNDHF